VRALGACLALAAVALAFTPVPLAPPLTLVAALLAAFLLEPSVVRRAWRLPAVLTVLAAAALSAVLVGWATAPGRGLAVGGAVAFRFLALLVLAALAARRLDAELLQRGAARVGMRRLGLAAGLAFNALPHLGEAARDSWTALAVRRRRRRPRLADMPRLAEVLLAHTGRIAEEAAAAASLRGHRALCPSVAPLPPVPLVVVVTGRPGAGKTPALCAVVETLSACRVPVAGFVQIPVFEAGGKGGYLVRDVASGQQRTLAVKVGEGRGQGGTPFRFEPAGFDFARTSLERAAAGCVLVLDELGPVELRGGGHMPAVRRALARPGIAAALATVRPALIPTFLAQLAAPSAVIVNVEEAPDPKAALLTALAPAISALSQRPPMNSPG
jgi:nucleoside-triphosphatase THEP1/energy-coupling factor transporter transmembrane protein EcfT